VKIERSDIFKELLHPANIGVKENIDAMILLDGLQPSIWCGYHISAKAIGRFWNGVSRLSFGIASLEAHEMSAFLRYLREKLEALGDDGIVLPDTSSVRLVEAYATQDKLLIVDFVIDGVCIPIGFPNHLFLKRGRDWKKRLTDCYLEHVEAARRHRTKIANRDIAMRNGFKALVNSIGFGSREAWLRMSPISCLSTVGFDRDPYDFALIILDKKLDETLGGYRAWSVRELQGFAADYRRDQRRRSKLRSQIIEANALGKIDVVTEALLQTLGKPAEEGWAECVKQMRRGDELSFSPNGKGGVEYLFEFREGVLSSSIRFPGGIYVAGRLQLDSELNEALYASAEGRFLSDFVDHPAFRLSKVKISKVSRFEGTTELRHPVRTKLIYPQVQSFAQPMMG